MIRYLALDRSSSEIRAEIDDAVRRVIDRAQFVLGPELERFERDFSASLGVAHAIGVGNGLEALELALRAAEVGEGDEVVVAGHTFIATWLAVTRVGAVPVPIDPDPVTRVITPDAVAAAVGPRTRAVIPVHIYGVPADGAGIAEVAQRHGLTVIEDAAQAHGARYHGVPVGTFAHLTAWSFYPGKNLGALGDGGAVTTDDSVLAERVRRLRNYGSTTKHEHTLIGTNSRLDEIQAAVLRVKLRHLGDWNDRRAATARRYLEAFDPLPLGLPVVPPWAEPAWHAFVVTSPERDALAASLLAGGVETAVHYRIPPHQQVCYAGSQVGAAVLPETERLHREVLSLPVGPELSPGEVETVVTAVCRAVGMVGAIRAVPTGSGTAP